MLPLEFFFSVCMFYKEFAVEARKGQDRQLQLASYSLAEKLWECFQFISQISRGTQIIHIFKF